MDTRISDRERKEKELVTLWLIKIPLIAWVVFAAVCALIATKEKWGIFWLTLGATGIYIVPVVLFIKIALIAIDKVK